MILYVGHIFHTSLLKFSCWFVYYLLFIFKAVGSELCDK